MVFWGMAVWQNWGRNWRVATLVAGVAGTTLFGCEEEKGVTKPEAVEENSEPEAPAPPPAPKTAPEFAVDEVGPKVGYSRIMMETPSGKPSTTGQSKLSEELTLEKKWIEGEPVTLQVARKAKPRWVAQYINALAALNPEQLAVSTETRREYPQSIPFLSDADLTNAEPCSLVGTITEDRGTAIWRISGGTARKRGRGMGGPDLTMTGETIERMAKKCDSKLFVVTGPEDVEWGLIFDLAASAMALPDADLERALYPSQELTAGQPVE